MPNKPPEPKKSSSGVVIVLLILGLLAVVGGGIFVAFKFAPTPAPKPTSTTPSGTAGSTPSGTAGSTPSASKPSPTVPVKEPEVVTKLNRVGDAVNQYARNHKRSAPNNLYGKNGQALLSWRVAILPELGFEELYRRFHTDEPWDSEHNKKLLDQMPPAYALTGPPAAKPGETYVQSLLSPAGSNTRTIFVAGDTTGIELLVPDGTDNTLFAFAAATPIEWTKPEDVKYDPNRLPTFQAYFDGKVAVLMANGRTRLAVPERFKPDVIRGMATANGDEDFELP